ncbi:unnamed protein product [Kuraishia capsulata CBS 1993]|uniref:Uncharacterized protein n=1 Tax=Kuraishia capsulata CBS 1993 TaxID=1382522 RepID=W6MJZ0_9ASCO|nr:uncharacterized protein KUCA_T00002584001 [Kuraishia capsulata CBS 1993]CDK26611.1 unnamed protein product [Kuraishia capsulata CBS 1993]
MAFSYVPPPYPKDTSAKPIQYGHSLEPHNKTQSFKGDPVPYDKNGGYDGQASSATYMSDFVKKNTDDEHKKKFAKQAGKLMIKGLQRFLTS